MFINKYAPVGPGRSTEINFGRYQNKGSGNTAVEPPQKPPEDEINLSNENKKMADYFTKLTLKLFKIETDDKELKTDIKQINTGLNYFI